MNKERLKKELWSLYKSYVEVDSDLSKEFYTKLQDFVLAAYTGSVLITGGYDPREINVDVESVEKQDRDSKMQ